MRYSSLKLSAICCAGSGTLSTTKRKTHTILQYDDSWINSKLFPLLKNKNSESEIIHAIIRWLMYVWHLPQPIRLTLFCFVSWTSLICWGCFTSDRAAVFRHQSLWSSLSLRQNRTSRLCIYNFRCSFYPQTKTSYYTWPHYRIFLSVSRENAIIPLTHS